MRQKQQAGGVSQELRDIYRDAWKQGIWLREFRSEKGFLIAAGSVAVLRNARRRLRRAGEIAPPLHRCPETLTLGNCISLGAEPGSGTTREQACRDAIKQYKQRA